MDTRFLHTFLCVVEQGSIAEAARRLDMTPASIAQRLKALELSVGSQLIERSGRTVAPTQAGIRILERARNVLREVRDLQSAASATDLPAGPLRLGATQTSLMGVVPPVLRQWVARHPGVEVFIEPGTTTVLYDRVLASELDAAVIVHPLFELPKTCGWQDLRQEPLVLLTQAKLKVDDVLATIASEPYIRCDRKVVAGRLADDYLRQHGIRPNTRFELDGLDYIAKLVSQGLGISVVPDWAITGAPDASVRRHALPSPLYRTVGVLWLRSCARLPLVQAFVSMAMRQAAVAKT